MEINQKCQKTNTRDQLTYFYYIFIKIIEHNWSYYILIKLIKKIYIHYFVLICIKSIIPTDQNAPTRTHHARNTHQHAPKRTQNARLKCLN